MQANVKNSFAASCQSGPDTSNLQQNLAHQGSNLFSTSTTRVWTQRGGICLISARRPTAGWRPSTKQHCNINIYACYNKALLKFQEVSPDWNSFYSAFMFNSVSVIDELKLNCLLSWLQLCFPGYIPNIQSIKSLRHQLDRDTAAYEPQHFMVNRGVWFIRISPFLDVLTVVKQHFYGLLPWRLNGNILRAESLQLSTLFLMKYTRFFLCCRNWILQQPKTPIKREAKVKATAV